jgi:hypothetical protein
MEGGNPILVLRTIVKKNIFGSKKKIMSSLIHLIFQLYFMDVKFQVATFLENWRKIE